MVFTGAFTVSLPFDLLEVINHFVDGMKVLRAIAEMLDYRPPLVVTEDFEDVVQGKKRIWRASVPL